MQPIAVIADDLTGALDTTAPFAKSGFSARAINDLGKVQAAVAGEIDVVAINTATRHVMPDQAAMTVQACARQISGSRRIFKKIDSRLKGNLNAEIKALVEVVRPRSVLVVPSVPDQGRFVSNGRLWGEGVSGTLSIRERIGDVGAPLEIPDCRDRADMDRIVAAMEDADDRLIVIARGFGEALARAHRAAVASADPSFRLLHPIMLAIGSRDPRTRAQVDTLMVANPDVLFRTAPNGRLERHEPADLQLLMCTQGAVDLTEHDVLSRFAESVAEDVRRSKPATLFLSGGETAAAVLTLLGVHSLDIAGEPDLGVVASTAVGYADSVMMVVTKSGGFGDVSVLSRLFGSEHREDLQVDFIGHTKVAG